MFVLPLINQACRDFACFLQSFHSVTNRPRVCMVKSKSSQVIFISRIEAKLHTKSGSFISHVDSDYSAHSPVDSSLFFFLFPSSSTSLSVVYYYFFFFLQTRYDLQLMLFLFTFVHSYIQILFTYYIHISSQKSSSLYTMRL